MADDKKKNALLGKLLGKKRSEALLTEEQNLPDKDTLINSENDYPSEYADWLTDAAAETSSDPDEDISEALAELFGENNTKESDEAPIFAIPGFEELAADDEEKFDLYNTEEPTEDSEPLSEREDELEYIEEPDEAPEEEVYEDFSEDVQEPSASVECEESESNTYAEESDEEITEEEHTSVSVDEDTATLLAALGYSDAANTAAKVKAPAKDNTRSRHSDLSLAYGYEGKEYIARSQTASVKSKYASDRMKTIIRLGATAFLAILLCVYDMFGNKFGGVLDSTVYPVVNIMISLQLLLIASAFSVKHLIAGLKAIFKGELNVHSISAAAVIIAVIYNAVLAIAVPETFTLYNFPAAVCLCLCALHDYFVLEREICVFDRLSSWQSVITLERVDAGTLASDLGESTDGAIDTVGQAFRLRKGEFAENYFRHVNRRHPQSKMLVFFVTPVAAIAFIMFFVSLAFNKTLAEAANAFAGVALFSLPAFMLVSMSFPFFTLITKSIGNDAVILSESDVNEHRRVDTVVLEEDDLFDDTSLTINRISVCDKNQMQDVFDIMCAVSAMYNKIGGRIAGAFRASTADGDTPSEVSVIKVEDGGFEGVAEGRRYYVGSDAYLTSKGISVMRYYDDKYIASNPGGVVLHIAVDDAEVFKLYLTYSISPSTLSVINELAATRTRIILRTIDPNVNLDLVTRLLSSAFDGNLTLIRKPYGESSAEDNCRKEGAIDGGIVVNGDAPEAILEIVRACRLFSAFSKFNFGAGAIVFGIGALLSLFLGFIGAVIGMPSIYVFIFQMASILPSIFFASIYLNK